jgi:CheY-like chemotaxis protein
MSKVMKGTILIVEDKHEFREIYGDRLRFGGYHVLDAGDGVEALEILKKNKVDLIMTDINMPNKDGFELIKDVRADLTNQAIPIIVMSVFDRGEHVEKANALGANEYLVKGRVTPNEVLEKIDKLLGK